MNKTLVKLLLVLFFITACLSFKFPSQQNINIVFIGDSITEGSGGPAFRPPVYAVDYLRSKLPRYTINHVNAGYSGRTTVDFLPGERDYAKIIKATDSLYSIANSQLLFSIMIGTNDSAIKGTHGAPVSAQSYKANLGVVIDTLLKRYPKIVVILNKAIWYSPNTQNNSMYLAEGLARLQSYGPQIDGMIKSYKGTHPGRVLLGDTAGFTFFKKNYGAFKQEQGKQGVFYLHPNEQGAAHLGELWGKAIYKALNK